MNSVLLQQQVGSGRALRSIFTPIGVEKNRPRCISPVALPTNSELADCGFHNCQWITSTALANVKVNRKMAFLG